MSDRSSRATTTSNDSSLDLDIEMARLDDDVALAKGNLADNDSDDGSMSDDEDDRALLGSEDRTRGRERSVRTVSTTWSQVKDIVVETAPTLLFTTVGLLFTGELLDHVSRWKAMARIDQLIIIIPVILNLKGNLEMNLSARLGTAANIGQLDDRQSRYQILLGNLALLQVQSTFVSFIAACLSFVISLLMPRSQPSSSPSAAASTMTQIMANITMPLPHPRRPRPPLPVPGARRPGVTEFVLVAATAMCSASLSSLLLGSFMCTLVVLCRHLKLNPDNIAPPIASCLGDLITLCLLGIVSTILINFLNTPLPLVLAVLLVLSAGACALLTRRNKYVRDLLSQGWTPLFGAMFISSATGIILDLFVSRYSGFALLAVVISGLPGSVGSVFVSRLSTTLHAAAASASSSISNKKPEPSLTLVMTTLFIITLPIEVAFLATLRGVGWLELPFIFVGSSVVFFCGAVVTSLFIARFLTNYLWGKGYDPDIYALPIHSSLVDLVGQLLLVICFEIVSLLGAKVQAKSGH